MHTYVKRLLREDIEKRLKDYPVVAILGPRQCGKSTLAKQIVSERDALYLDLESERDRRKLTSPLDFFDYAQKRMICLDEIQEVPDLFKDIKSYVDQDKRAGQFLILGSASIDLLRQSSETLAGRIAYLELTPFRLEECGAEHLLDRWVKGGFPDSYLKKNIESSLDWRDQFVKTYVERDVPKLGVGLSSPHIKRCWQMCAHQHGHVLNKAALAESLGSTYHGVQSYLDMLNQSFLITILEPFEMNTKKRLVKSPKVFIRDSGLLHALLDIETYEDLLGHPVIGNSWEGLVLEELRAGFPKLTLRFYRTSNGTEVDFVVSKGKTHIVVECKASSAPQVTRGFYESVNAISPQYAYVVAPVESGYPLGENIKVVNPFELIDAIKQHFYA